MNSAKAWLDRTDPRALELTQGSQEAARAKRDEARQRFEDANRAAFLRECERDGIEPGGNVSPSLLKILGNGRSKANAG